METNEKSSSGVGLVRWRGGDWVVGREGFLMKV